MNLSKSYNRILILVSLVVFLVTGQAGAKGFFWCLGEDGRSRLEFTLIDSCCNPEGAGVLDYEHNFSSLAAEEDDCGPCLDIATSFETAFNLGRDNDTLADIVIPISFGLINPSPQLSHPAKDTLAFHLSPPWVNQTLLKHRTVVLLN